MSSERRPAERGKNVKVAKVARAPRSDRKRDEPDTFALRLKQWRRGLLSSVSSSRSGLDTPLDASRRNRRSGPPVDAERFGRASERFARFMGTATFLVGMTVFVFGWLAWNWLAPENLQFDPRRLNFTLMTLILSLQASYAAPLILLAQNRQADRDRVAAEQDRDRAERALADTEFLAREVAALRIALGEVATRDFVRSELRTVLEEFRDGEEKPARAKKKAPSKTPKSQKEAREPSNGGSNGAAKPAVDTSGNGAQSPSHHSGLTNDATVPTESS